MSILSRTEIVNHVREYGLIERFTEESLQPASYDMSLGREYIHKGKREYFENQKGNIHLEPGDFALLSTHELLNMPLTLIGHNGLMSPWAKLGLVSLFSPQIDPGFQGMLIVPVVNLGNEVVTIEYGKPMFTIEFELLNTPAEKKWVELPGNKKQVSMQNIRIPQYLPTTLDRKKDLIRLQRLEDHISDLNDFKKAATVTIKVVLSLVGLMGAVAGVLALIN